MSRHLALFYHVWCPENFLITRFVVDEQLKRIARSGLPNHADVICCISGVNHQAIQAFISSYDWVTIRVSTADESRFEGVTLELLQDHCARTPRLQGVGYIHTKGLRELATHCSDKRLRAINSWRQFLEWGTIDRWRDSTALLGQFDAVGVNWREHPWPHFGGNAWWANPEYIRDLIPPITGDFPPGDYSFIVQTGPIRQRIIDRLNFERWIGLNRPKCFSFYGYPFVANGKDLPPEFHDLFENDIDPYYRAFSV